MFTQCCQLYTKMLIFLFIKFVIVVYTEVSIRGGDLKTHFIPVSYKIFLVNIFMAVNVTSAASPRVMEVWGWLMRLLLSLSFMK